MIPESRRDSSTMMRKQLAIGLAEGRAPCASTCAEPEIEASGLRISWAIAAAISPTAAMRSRRPLAARRLADLGEVAEVDDEAQSGPASAPRSGVTCSRRACRRPPAFLPRAPGAERGLRREPPPSDTLERHSRSPMRLARRAARCARGCARRPGWRARRGRRRRRRARPSRPNAARPRKARTAARWPRARRSSRVSACWSECVEVGGEERDEGEPGAGDEELERQRSTGRIAGTGRGTAGGCSMPNAISLRHASRRDEGGRRPR